uniref:DEP domain-containing protein n=1 Tax=Angiostrongylus cantonensis TaxID=6313 RepID=A0A0K0DCB4_ANGCA
MSKDTTPTRRNTSTQHSGKSSERCSCSGDGPHSKYKATALWNNIVRRFREELPVKRHRRQLTYFEDSFTGKEAVDFLMVLLPRLLFEGRQVDRLRSTHQRKSPDQFQFLKIETPASNRGFDRRMSSSHGNLLSLLPTHSQLTHKESDSADSLAETIDSRIVEVNFSLRPSPLKRNNTPKAFRTGFKDEESATKISQTELESSSKAVSTQNITHVASSLAKENEVAGKESAYEWLTLVRRKMTQNNKLPLSQRSSNPYKQVEKSEKLGEHRKRTGDGMVKSELSELEYAPLKVTHRRITEIDSWLVWKNCLLARVGVSGIVKLRSDRDDFSSYLMRLMRYLEQFPFPSGSANIITYKDNQEVNVFRTVCSHLTREQPILTNAQASALLYVISLHNAVRSDLPHLGVPKYNEVLNLPGLKESPELLQRLNEMCLKLQPNSDLIELLLRPPDHILEALSLLLLSLPSPRRRRLHYLIRFMNKISANHCLQLDDVHSNRYAVLKGLSGSIVSTQGASPLSTSQCSHLVSLLLDYEKEIFSVPKGLILEVDAAIRERQREKVTPVGQSPGLRSEMADYVQFCEPAKGSEYEEQNLNLVDNLLELLDQICIDENLTVQEKRKRLKKFKKTYPSVYSRRFPSPELSIPKKKERENRFLFKLFSR